MRDDDTISKLIMSPQTRDAIERGVLDRSNEESIMEKLLGNTIGDLIARAKKVKSNPLEVKRGDRIPLGLLNEALGYSPEHAEFIRKYRRSQTTQEEREKRRARSRRARASRRRNQQIAAQARRRRQKIHRRAA